MKQKEKTLLTTKHFLLVLALIVCVNFLFSEVLPVQPPSGNSHLSVPFTIKGTVSPDKKYYEKDEIVSFSGYIKLNREHIMYIPDKQYHVRTNCFTGYRTRKLEILNSNMDSLFVMDDINDSLFISATAKVTKLTALVDICFNVSRIGYNSSVQHYIDKGIILNPHDPEVIWALQHDEQDFDGISNTSPMSGRHLKKKNYPHSKLETSRLPHNLMYNSELRLWFYHFEHPEAVEIVSLSVDDYGAFYGENSQYAPEIVDDTLMVVHSTNAIGSTGTVFFTYLYDNVEYYYDYEFYIRGSIDIEITFGYEEDDIENFHAGMGRVNIYRCNESNFYDAFEYDSQYLETPGEPYESYDILPNNNQNTCTIDISDFDRGFVGFEIEFQKDFFQLLEQPEDQDNCHPDQWINKKYWVILYHPEVYYSSSYNGNVYLYINFINDEENNYAEHVPNNCGMIYLHDKDVCGAFNVIRQIDRAEDFSTSYLNNPPMNDSLFIFSDFDTDWFYPGYEHKMTTAYFVYSGHPLSHNNQQFIHLYGGDKETYPGNETYQYQLWANNIILHELGHMYHHNFSIVPVSYAGDSGKWHTPPDDNNLSFSYTESVADLISNSIRSQTDAGTETRFDHQLDSTLSGITNSDLYRFNNLYSENNKLPN